MIGQVVDTNFPLYRQEEVLLPSLYSIEEETTLSGKTLKHLKIQVFQVILV